MTVMDEMDRLMELADKITDSREEVQKNLPNGR